MTRPYTTMLGLAIAIAGVAAAAGTALLVTEQGKAGQVLLFSSYVLLGPGLLGLYLAQAGRLGGEGHAGFHLAFLGVIASMPLAAVLTLGHLGVPEAVSLVRSGALRPFGVVGDYALLAGLAAFAVGTARAGVLPRQAAIVLCAGVASLVAAQMMVFPMVTWLVGNALNAVGFAWMGYAAHAQRGQPAPRLSSAAA